MDMSVSARGSSALRDYRNSAAAGTGTTFTQAAQSLRSPPIDGQSSPPEGQGLSDKAETFSNRGKAEIMDPINASAMEKHLLSVREYMFELEEHSNAETAHWNKSMRMLDEFMGKMSRELGVPRGAMAIPNDPFGSEPVRTSSGAIHPLSDRIKDYIRARQDEWNDFQSSSFPPIPSFEEWQQARG